MTDPDKILDLVSAVTGGEYLKVEEDLGEGYVRLRVSEAERRQAKHDIRSVEDVVVELLRNARDAHAHRIFVATAREGELRTVTFVDDGVGIPAPMHERVFEPRVTSKLETMVMDRWGVHGRGMALYSVRSNVREAHICASDAHKGAAVRVIADAEVLPERADQSRWPEVEPREDGRLHVIRGPHNILRRVVEFACEHPEVDVYVGSPTEIIATMRSVARGARDATDLLFCEDPGKLPVWQRPACADDASTVTELAAGVGLEISERTAHRVLAGDIPVCSTVMAVLRPDRGERPRAEADIYRDRRGLRVHAADLASFRRALEEAFDVLAERYYLTLRGEPKVTVGRDEIRVRFEVDKDD